MKGKTWVTWESLYSEERKRTDIIKGVARGQKSIEKPRQE
jgi:hypothetical protein